MDFRLGINYWPISSAMYWWKRFDAQEVRQDFALIRETGFDSVRIFLLWEDFQPRPHTIQKAAIQNLTTVTGIAGDNSLSLIPTFFTGHMSGVNWIPRWALTSLTQPQRFRVIAENKVVEAQPRNWYTDAEILEAQTVLVGEIADALHDKENIWAWDLGNENSNCVVPPNHDAAVEWLSRITESIRSADREHAITIGLHMEDLEEDRKLGPYEAGQFCDFLSMHGYPIYARWANGPTDALLLPFLGLITEWLGRKRVLFEEFGAPRLPLTTDEDLRSANVKLLTESEAAEFTSAALSLLKSWNMLGGFLWCFGDYAKRLWHLPPLDEAVHERYFGLFRNDRSRKPAADTVSHFNRTADHNVKRDFDWINIKPDEFYDSPGQNLMQLYRRFQTLTAN